MKKVFLLLILYNIFSFQVFANELEVSLQNKKSIPENNIKTDIIEDELLNHKTFQNKLQYVYPEPEAITDELLKTNFHKDNVFYLGISKCGEYEIKQITDELISDDFIMKAKNSEIIMPKEEDNNFIEKTINLKKVRTVMAKKKYDFTKKQIPVKIKLAQNFSHKLGKLEGDLLEFISQNEFKINKKLYPKGTVVLGRIEAISPSDKMGTPESIKIDNFFIDNNPDTQEDDINLNGHISKDGANRSIWVYPLYQAGNIMFYVAGFLFVPIHGGHVKISANETYTVFYETP